MALPAKQRAFARKYVKNNGNASKSYREAGYKASTDLTARVEASRLLTKPNIQKEIKRLVSKEVKADILTAKDVLSGLSDKAKADIADVLEPDGSFDLAKAKERGKSKLIKKLSFDKDTGRVVGVELYSAHEAERDLGKFHKLFSERVETVDLTDHERDKVVVANELASMALSSDLSPAECEAILQPRFADKSRPSYDERLDPTKNPQVWPSGNLLTDKDLQPATESVS